MRTYHSTGFRALAGGSIEVEGRWSGVRWMALALLPVLFVGMRSPPLLALIGAAAAYLYVFPARRRVLFDAAGACLRIEHAGLFAERGRRTIPFDEIRGLVFHALGRRVGRVEHAVLARTAQGTVYLTTHAGKREAEALAERLRALMVFESSASTAR